ncbi:hypothetical protein [Streptomyces sp. NPDC051994]|uniref:hypothetical protein n=1 Tax=unclassified Streptomyces TaxID=2593676 RepID=UPI0034138CC2
MNRTLGTVLTTAVLAATAQAGIAASPAAADSLQNMIKNAATGKCLQGTDNGTPYAHAVKMVPCTRSNQAIWWGLTAGRIMMVRAGGSASQVCLSIPKSPRGDFPHDVVTARCGDLNYNQSFTTIRGTSTIGSPEPCYVGHYSSGDTWASCYVSSGNNTKWTWLS